MLKDTMEQLKKYEGSKMYNNGKYAIRNVNTHNMSRIYLCTLLLPDYYLMER